MVALEIFYRYFMLFIFHTFPTCFVPKPEQPDDLRYTGCGEVNEYSYEMRSFLQNYYEVN